MNWFERYGVVGGYFLFTLLLWLYSATNISIPQHSIKYVAAILGLASVLPFGYLISIFSQYLYYVGCPFLGIRIHNEIAQIIKQKQKFQKKIQLQDSFAEADNEAIITYWDRVKFFRGDQLRNFKYIAEFITKRFAVVSINNSIIVATVLAFIAAVFLVILLPKVKWECSEKFWIASVFSALAIAVACFSRDKLNKQIITVNKELYDARESNAGLRKQKEPKLGDYEKLIGSWRHFFKKGGHT